MSTTRVFALVFVASAIAASLAGGLGYSTSAHAGDRGVKTACCLEFTQDEGAPAQQSSDWMAAQVAHGHSNFVVVPVGSRTTLCAW